MSELITLDVGSGGKKTAELIAKMILPVLGNDALNELGDGAVLPGADRLVFSTDSFVVSPWNFPGGDIGKLSVCGTVNDICMAGGDPKFLSLSLILEEGFPVEQLEMILRSVRRTAERAGVQIVTGDTKVVEHGKGDGIFINTSGIGILRTPGLSPAAIQPGDAILVSGPVGSHGMAVMLARNQGMLESDIVSDCASVRDPALALAVLGKDLRCMRDPTRGGLVTTLNEWLEDGRIGIDLEEEKIPVERGVAAAADMLGLDPLYSACEGRLIAAVAPERAGEALSVLKRFSVSEGAAVIGFACADHPGKLVIRTPYGGQRIAAKLAGAQLPRIC